MDKFLEIAFANYLKGEPEVLDKYLEMFKPFLSKIKELVSEKIYEDLENSFVSYACEVNSYYAVQGMKLALSIMEGTYVPRM